MIPGRLRQRTLKQIFNTLRVRSGRFSSGICRHDPTEIMVFVTNRCNFSCNTCPFTHASPWSPVPDVPDIPPEKFEQILDTYRGASMVGLVGGEPLLHPQLDRLITAAAARSMTVNLSTNGFLLTEERIRSLLNLPIGYINISIDAVDAEEFHRLRGGSRSVYETVISHAALLGSLKQTARRPVQVYLSFVTDALNLHRL
ncbi:radical SAM protein, partial [bacterium]|nr:radical SAM protein [candidate division CSSED10-310 bacterium]